MIPRENPHYAPPNAFVNATSGTDHYQRPTHCPYCGCVGRHVIRRYEGIWFRLRCNECGGDFKVKCRAERRAR